MLVDSFEPKHTLDNAVVVFFVKISQLGANTYSSRERHGLSSIVQLQLCVGLVT